VKKKQKIELTREEGWHTESELVELKWSKWDTQLFRNISKTTTNFGPFCKSESSPLIKSNSVAEEKDRRGQREMQGFG